MICEIETVWSFIYTVGSRQSERDWGKGSLGLPMA